MADIPYVGKIGGFFLGRGNPIADVHSIQYLPAGGNTRSYIDCVYALPAGATISSVADLEQYVVWKLKPFVPYDSTCSIIITGDDTTQKFTVQVMKNGEDVTYSLAKFNGWAYIINDVLPAYRLFVHDIPYSQVITDCTEFSVTELIDAYKEAEHISDTKYDDTKGEYSVDASAITSKAGGAFPSSGAIGCQHTVSVPYTLTEDQSTNDVWMVVKQNTSPTPLEIKTIQVATTYTGVGATSIYVYHSSGLLVYQYESNWYTPSVTSRTIGGNTYNYVTIDLTALSTGTFSLKRNETYYIKVKHASNNDNHYYYRNGGILGIVGYTTANINLTYQTYDISSLTYEGIKSSEADMLAVSTANHYARYTGSQNCFTPNTVYKCKTTFTYAGSTTNDVDLLAMADGAIGMYGGASGALSLGNHPYQKTGAAISVTVTDTPSIIYTETVSTKVFKYTGNDVDIFFKDKFYRCTNPMTVKAEITSAPDPDTVSVGDTYFATVGIYYDSHSSGWNDAGFYQVTNIDSENHSYTVAKQNSPVTDVSNDMKSTLTEINNSNISTYYDSMTSVDLTGVTINTDHKYEILMGG